MHAAEPEDDALLVLLHDADPHQQQHDEDESQEDDQNTERLHGCLPRRGHLPRRTGAVCTRTYPYGVADFAGVRLHVVTGKGGTGKTTVAAALALALAASGGKKVLLIEVEGRQGIAQLFDSPPLPYEERKVAVAPGGGDVYALAVDPEAGAAGLPPHVLQALARTASRPARCAGSAPSTSRRRSRPACATCCSPARSREVVVRQGPSGRAYDAVVLDAPPTGRIARFLNISHEIGGLAKVGPLKSQSDGVMAVFRSPQTAVHLVTLLEEMPVQETCRRHRRADQGGAAGRRRHRQHGPHAAAARPPTWPRPDAASSTSPRCAAGPEGAGLEPPPPWSPRWPGRPPTTRTASRSRSADVTASPPCTGRRTSCRCCPTPSTSAASTGWPSCCTSVGTGMSAQCRRRRDDRHRQDHRLLRLGRRRQDDDRGRARPRGPPSAAAVPSS